MDEKPWKLWNMVRSRLILKAEKNEFIWRIAECFKKETWNTQLRQECVWTGDEDYWACMWLKRNIIAVPPPHMTGSL